MEDLKMFPDTHPNPRLNLMRDYVTEVVRALAIGGLRVDRSWLDPGAPRDATVLYRDVEEDLWALVWEEETGWRTGRFVRGEPGVLTELAAASYLGGGVLVRPAEVSERLSAGVRAPRTVYRSMRDVRDGLDDVLRAY